MRELCARFLLAHDFARAQNLLKAFGLEAWVPVFFFRE